jgi:nicotinamidase-related amidase
VSTLTSALLVIDVQNSFRHKPYWNDADALPFFAKIQTLIHGAAASGVAVIQILHAEESGVFSIDSGLVTTMSGISIDPTAVFYKTSHSAFVGSGLDVWLVRHGIRNVLVSGIRTEQCCETTARHASDIGYNVDYVSEATLTFPMLDRKGRLWSAADIRERTELVLQDRFAQIVTVDQALHTLRSAGRMLQPA